MRRRRWFLSVALGLGWVGQIEGWEVTAASEAGASKEARTSEPAPSDVLNRYLLAQAKVHFDARRKAIAAIKTPADVERRQEVLRAFFLKSLGDLPERTPLNPRVMGTLEQEGYRVEKVIFESRPRHHVTASFYLPQGQGPFPGVLVPCGHSDNGKAGTTYQQICILLAKHGVAVLCYDPIGQGERFQMLDPSGKPVIRGTTEHTMAGVGALLIGRQLASYRIWDGFRALDYLASRPEVDPKRLGCTGNSGGGTMTAYLMALDNRIRVAVPSCYITSLERLFETIGPQDAEQNITGQVAAGMEHADYITMRAPEPTLLSVGTRDFFDIRGSWDTFREVKLIFGRMGFGERVDLFESDEEHGFTKPRRVAAARWMSRWLLQRDEAFDEPEFPIATDAELQCTRSGQVLTDFHGVSVFDLNRERERELRKAREAAGARRSLAEFRVEVKKRLGLGDWKARRLPVTNGGAIRSADPPDGKIRTFESEPGIKIEAIEWSEGKQPANAPTVVIVGLGSEQPQELRKMKPDWLDGTDSRFIRFDLRGLSPSPPRAGDRGHESPFGPDWREAFMALSIDRPLLGQRTAELLDILETLDAEQAGKESAGFHVVGVGTSGPVVLHAALLDERRLIKKVTIQNSLVSWSNIVEKGLSRDQLSSVLPGVLMSYDLPDLAAPIAPLPLAIVDAVDSEGKRVPANDVRGIYARCVRTYGASGAIEIR
jgi:dienelactone hydrolase/pimeloyl-ACP methyl ester carboxylesterase